jgi:ferritin
MISNTMVDALNHQLNLELSSAYLYLGMAAHFEKENLQGFAHWMRRQEEEERTHAFKFFDHIVERGAAVKLGVIAAPPVAWDSHLSLFEEVLQHEKQVTAAIYGLMDQATAERDYATAQFLHWFVQEQVEEEAAATYVIERLKMVGESKSGLLYIDKELGKRSSE